MPRLKRPSSADSKEVGAGGEVTRPGPLHGALVTHKDPFGLTVACKAVLVGFHCPLPPRRITAKGWPGPTTAREGPNRATA